MGKAEGFMILYLGNKDFVMKNSLLAISSFVLGK